MPKYLVYILRGEDWIEDEIEADNPTHAATLYRENTLARGDVIIDVRKKKERRFLGKKAN